MCGIIGYVGSPKHGQWNQTHGLLTELLTQSIERGRHATGFAARTERLDSPRDGRIITDKQPIDATEFVVRNPFWRALERIRCQSIIGHVRYATSGAPEVNANNHPHHGVVDGSPFSLIHNGWYNNVNEMVDRHSLILQTDCDTEVAARLIERVGSIQAGMTVCLKELRGAQALAVLEHRTGTVWLARDDNRPLYVCRLRDDRRYCFASTLPILVRSVEERLGKASHWISDMIPLAPGYVHTLTPDLRFVVRSTKPTFTEFEESLE